MENLKFWEYCPACLGTLGFVEAKAEEGKIIAVVLCRECGWEQKITISIAQGG